MDRNITVNYSPSREWWADMLESLWVTVLEGGSNYWLNEVDYDKPPKMMFPSDKPHLKNGERLMENFDVRLWDDEAIYTVKTFDVIHKGISLLPDDIKVVIMNNGDWDANDADHIFQLGVFGEVRYG